MTETTKPRAKPTAANTAMSEKELRNAMDADPHDPWGFAPKRPPTYNPPEVYQPPEDKVVNRMLVLAAVACGTFWALIIIGVVLLIRWS